MLQRNDFKIEICANGVESCMTAQQGGADRVELCAGIPEGGTTPSFGEILTARKVLTTTRLHVIIRPRGGDFLYTDIEMERMIADIDIARELGADGVVFGCLTEKGDIDMDRNAVLMSHTAGMATTFHRAFDHCNNPQTALEQLITLGFDRVLTSGQQPTAPQGASLLAELHRQADGRIAILAGCGVNETNIRQLFLDTDVREYHFSARELTASKMLYRNDKVYMGNPDADELSLPYTTVRRVEDTIAALMKR